VRSQQRHTKSANFFIKLLGWQREPILLVGVEGKSEMVTGWKGLFRRRKSFIKITSILVSLHLLVIQTSFMLYITGCEHNPVLLSSGFSTSPGDTATSQETKTD